jgi:hypothetical protein
MAKDKRTPEGKKRCQSINLIGMQCTKRKNHVHKDIDVVHQAGVFVWRSNAPKPTSRRGASTTHVIFDETARVALSGFDLSKHIQPGSTIEFSTEQRPADSNPFFAPGLDWHGLTGAAQARAETRAQEPFDDIERCDCVGCKAERARTPEPIDPITATPEQQLTEWWMTAAEDEIARTVPKAIEYSATDLTDIGHDLARTMGREVSDEEAAELGVFFYLRGKVARWVGAVMAGKRVSDDTLFDIGVYVRMCQRIREFGNWPGVTLPEAATVEPNYNNRSAG